MINFEKNYIRTPNLLKLIFKVNESQIPSDIYVVFYGVKGYLKKINNEFINNVWNRIFYIEKNDLKLETDITMNNNKIINVSQISFNKTGEIGSSLNGKKISEMGDGTEDNDAVNLKQVLTYNNTINNTINNEIKLVNDKMEVLFKIANDNLNSTIVEYGFEKYLLCLFYLDKDQFPNGTKVSKWENRIRTLNNHDATASDVIYRPTVDDDLNFSYLSFDTNDHLEVDFDLNNEEYLNIFVIFRIFAPFGEERESIVNGIFGADNGNNGCFIAVDQSKDDYELIVGFGGGRQSLTSFKSKASPVTLNFSLLSVHYTVARENTSTIWCNGKYLDTFQRENLSGNKSNFFIGRFGSSHTSTTNNSKQILYFSLVSQCKMTNRDIKIFHSYLCKKYKIDHDPIDTS